MKLQLQIQTKLWTNLASTLLASPNPLVPMFSRLRMKFEMHMERLTSNQGWLKAATLTQCNSRIWLQTPISPHLIKPRLRWKRSLNIGIVLNLLLTQPLLLISYVGNPCNNFSVSWKTIKEEINGSFDLSKRIIQPKPDKDDEKWLVDVWKAPPAPLKNPSPPRNFWICPNQDQIWNRSPSKLCPKKKHGRLFLASISCSLSPSLIFCLVQSRLCSSRHTQSSISSSQYCNQ